MKICYALLFSFLLIGGTALAQDGPRLIVNEVLADMPVDAPGDANGDGTRDAAQDEFIELANATLEPLDLTGWMVGDDEGINFAFPEGYTLGPLEIVVIFGGGDVSGVTGYDPDPLATRVFQADSSVGNGFANSGEYIVIQSADGSEDTYVAYNSKVDLGAPETDATAGIEFEHGVNIHVPADMDQSMVRSPDGNIDEDDPFVLHSTVSDSLFSPGVTIDGSTRIPSPFAARLLVNEFLVDPPVDEPGDANADGVRHAQEDEFVELTNISDEPLDLTGWEVGDDERINFTFPDGYVLPSRAFVVIFGGGDLTNVPGYDPDPMLTRVFASDSVGNGLANGGDYIVITSPDGNEDMYVAYNSKTDTGPPTTDAVFGIDFEYAVNVHAPADEDVALTRSPDGNTNVPDPFVAHNTVSSALFSPGTTISGAEEMPKPLPPLTIVINEVLADPPVDAPGDANMDGTRDAAQDEFVELANVSDEPVDIGGWMLGDDEGIAFTFPDGYVLQPRDIIAVFGGGDVSNVEGYDADPLQTRVFQADSSVGNGLANGGEIIVLLSDDGEYDTYLAYGSLSNTGGPAADSAVPDGTEFEVELNIAAPGNADNSFTRFPDGNTNVIDPYVQHLEVSSAAFSPAATVDGRDNLPPPQPPLTIVINEVLADAAGDANGDGVTDALEDQFIEILNASEETAVDLSGWSVGDPGGLAFTFPEGYVLAPQKIAAVFGGGDVSLAPGYNADPLQSRVFAADGTLGDGLDAAGDYAVLVSGDGAYDAYVAFGSASGGAVPEITGSDAVEWEFALNTAAEADQDNSITRHPDGNFLAPDPFVQHLSVASEPWSPATTIDGLGGLDEFKDVPHPWGTGYVLDYNWWERDRVEVREAPELFPLVMNQGTIEFWFRPDSLITHDTHDPDWTYLISKNFGGNNPGDLGIGFERGDGRLLFFMQDGENTTNLYQNDNLRTEFHPRWYHVAVTWNTESMMRMFIDGEKVAEAPSAVPLLGGEMQMAIGGGAADLWNQRFESFRGMMDEVRISVVERYTESFEKPSEPYEVDQYTLALWHFDEGEGEIAEDVTGNGFTGYLGGFDLEGNPDPASAPTWIDASTLVGTDVESAELPEKFALDQNYPNPFNPTTTIHYRVPRASDVNVSIYNVLGQRVAVLVNDALAAGSYTINYRADHLASGVYFYVLQAEDVHLVRKMMLIK